MAYRQLEAEEPHLRIVLVGKTGVGKSAAGNTILGKRSFEAKISASSVTSHCRKEIEDVGGQTLAVIDTPGLFDTRKEEMEVKKEIAKCISFAAPGPHVFLVVLQPNRFTKQEEEIVRIIQEMFGNQASKYTMVLFTQGDHLKEEGVSIDNLISENESLCDFIEKCGGRYHLFDNKDNDLIQVFDLVKKINIMVKRNGKKYYTNEMFEEAQRAIAAEMERLQRQNPGMPSDEARRTAESDNSFIQAFIGAGVGTAIGATLGAAVGAVVGGAATAAVGAKVGAAAGAGAGAIVAVIPKLVKEKSCSIQ